MFIPLEILFFIWLVAMIISAISAIASWRIGRKPMAVTLAGFSFGAASMLSFYTMLLYVPISGNYQFQIAWSRWAIGINGLMILGGSLSALIASRAR